MIQVAGSRFGPRPSVGVIFLAVCAIVGAGLIVVAVGHWRIGVVMIGGSQLIAAAARLQLSPYGAGMLKVRRKRWVDVTMLSLIGLALIALAITIPDQPS